MARSKTIYISGTGKPKPGQGIKVWGPRKKYSPSKRNYSTTDRATFTARVVREIELEEHYGDKNNLYGFVNVYQELYNSMYYNILTRMYEEIMIKSYSCNISLDSSSTLVNPNTPQTVFYIAQDRNGIPYEGGSKKPQDYASVRSMPINFYSPFKTWAGLSVSGIQESSSFISCDLFKPNTGLFGVIDSSGLTDDGNYCYSQNQTYSQFMFKPVILMGVKNLNNARPVFVCEFRFNIVGRGIRAVQNEPSNITVENSATAADIKAGKIAFTRNGETLNGTMISPINTDITLDENGVYNVGDKSGGYPISAVSQITVNVPAAHPVIDTLQLMDRSISSVSHVVPLSVLPQHEFPSNGVISDIDATYVMTAGDSEYYIAYFTSFETGENAVMLTLAFSRCAIISDGTYTAYTPFTSDNADSYRLIPSVYFSGINFGSLQSPHLVVTFGNVSSGNYDGYFGCLPAFVNKLISSPFGDLATYYSGVSLNTQKYDLNSIL